MERDRLGLRRAIGAWSPILALAALASALAAPGPPGLGGGVRLPTMGGSLAGLRGPRGIPAIVFVSRRPIAGEPLAVPGLGPVQRVAAPGGRLMLRSPDGRLRELTPPGALFDVSDPAVSFDGRRVAFAGTPHPDSAWRLWTIGVDGRGLRAITSPAPAAGRRADDFDPCWIGERRICFASTRWPLIAQYADVPASNLYVLDVPPEGGGPGTPYRITSERNGAEEPALDPRRGEIVFARWWFNRDQASATGIADAAHPALPRDSVNLWETVALGEDGLHLACAGLQSRRAAMAYQPAFLEDGTAVGVYALNLGLWPRSGPLGVQRFPGRVGRAERIAGAAIPDSARHAYADASGLAAPSACAPAGLPDGRVVFAYSPGARGDYGLYVVDAAGRFAPQALVDFPGTLELDPAPVVPRPAPFLHGLPGPATATAPATSRELGARGGFTYRSLDVFRSVRPALGAPGRVSGARVRFYAAPRDLAGADTVMMIREQVVGRDGSVVAPDLPADVPLFEQLVDAEGRVLASAHGPAHVAGFNAGAAGRESRCVGCHFGHSATRFPAAGRPGR